MLTSGGAPARSTGKNLGARDAYVTAVLSGTVAGNCVGESRCPC